MGPDEPLCAQMVPPKQGPGLEGTCQKPYLYAKRAVGYLSMFWVHKEKGRAGLKKSSEGDGDGLVG